MLNEDAVARGVLCFFVLPAVWSAGSVATGWHAVLMIPAAVAFALLSALIGYARGRSKRVALRYFVGTSVMMGVAFLIATWVLLAGVCEHCELIGDRLERGPNLPDALTDIASSS